MKKILFSLILIMSVGLSSCRSVLDYVKKVELGMTKQEVIKIMGKDYSRSAAFVGDDNSDMELIRYEGIREYDYLFTFRNNKLIEWHEEIKPQYYHTPNNNTESQKK